MRRHLTAVAVACVGFIAAADAPRLIRVAVSANVGHSVTASSETSSQQTVTIRDKAGKVLRSTTTSNIERSERTDTTVRRGPDSATYRAEWRKCEREQNGRREALPLQGASIAITVRGDHVGLMRSDARPIDESTRASLVDFVRRSNRVERNNACVSTEPLAIGASWPLAKDDVDACFGGLGTPEGAAGSGQLAAVENGYAVIDFRFSERIRNLGPLAFDTPAPVDGTARLRVSLSNPIEWTLETALHLSGSAHPRGPNQPSLATDLRVREVARSAN